MSNDTTALQERLARAFWEYEAGPSAIPWERFVVRCPEVAAERMRNVAPFLPVIAAEVQAAKADAWDEGYLDRSPYGGRARSRADNPYRATETGDRA